MELTARQAAGGIVRGWQFGKPNGCPGRPSAAGVIYIAAEFIYYGFMFFVYFAFAVAPLSAVP